MMTEEKKTVDRRKPKFLRTDWHKKIKLGSSVKKNRKWRGAKGRHNKLRLNRKGHPQRPKIGWGADARTKGFVDGIKSVRVENIKELKAVKKNTGIIIGAIGKKKKELIITKAKEMKIKILNKYKETAPKGILQDMEDKK